MPVWYLVIQATQAILVISSTIYTWRSAQQLAARSAVDDVRRKCDENEHRVLRLEEGIKHLPNAADVAELRANVGVLLERTKHLDGWIENVARGLERIDIWLRENK